jgi:hypothetical protein
MSQGLVRKLFSAKGAFQLLLAYLQKISDTLLPVPPASTLMVAALSAKLFRKRSGPPWCLANMSLPNAR